MTSKIRMILVDLDGTLLQGVNGISSANRQAFERARKAGILPVICTGRTPYESDFAVQAIGADRYMIAMNGLSVYENYAQKKLLHADYMQRDTAQALFSILDKANIFYQVYAGDRAYCAEASARQIHTSGMDESYRAFHTGLHTVVRNLTEHLDSIGLETTKVFISLDDPQKMADIRRTINQLPELNTLASGPHYLEVVPDGADKQQAVRMLRQHLGLTKEEIMAIGDSENDLGMLREAGVSVAMGNGCDAAKRIADFVAPRNDEDGVAAAIHKLVFGGNL